VSRFLRVLPFVALACAAVDTVLVRWRMPHRPADVVLFLQAFALWFVFGVLALAPAILGAALWRRWRPAQVPIEPRRELASAAAALGAWMALPVIAHARLDAYSDLGGDLSKLAAAKPWLDVLAWCALAAAVLWTIARVLPRIAPGIAAGVLTVASLAAGLFVDFHEGIDAPKPSAATARPNLLLLVWDTTRAQSLNIYGYERDTTPSLAKLASESIVFENARSASRYTLTSHLSMLTGVYPSHHGARMTRQAIRPQQTPSIAATLRRAGYRTGGFVGTGVLRADTGVAFGFEEWDDQVDPPVCDTSAWSLVHDLQSLLASFGPPFSQNGQPHWIQDFSRPASEVLARASRWIHDGDPRPWFCMVNLYDVHWPYVPERPANERWVEPYTGSIDGYLTRSDRFEKGRKLDEADQRHLRELYDAEMWELDTAVDRFLAGLDLATANTAVVMVSDHGEAFGEGGRYEHNDILEPQVRIPFLVRLPPVAAARPRRIARPVSGVDVAPTLIAIAQIADAPKYAGRNVLDEPPASDEGERTILVEDRDQMSRTDVRIALYRGTWKLVRTGLDAEQRYFLYDLASDPVGLRDVSAEHAEVLAEMKTELERFRAQWNADDVRDMQGEQISNDEALKLLGYTGK
jgi:arylsulfatase A-like enzyme